MTCTLEKKELCIGPGFSFYSDGTPPFLLLPQCVPWVGERSGCLNLPPDTSKVVIHIPSLAPEAMEEGKEGVSEVAAPREAKEKKQ